MLRVIALVLILCLLPVAVQAAEVRASGHIAAGATTTVVTGVAGQTIALMSGSVCVDGAGVTTKITIQDSTPTNLIGTAVVYQLLAGQCLTFPTRGGNPYGTIAAAGKHLQIVTDVAGPVEYYLEVIQQ